MKCKLMILRKFFTQRSRDIPQTDQWKFRVSHNWEDTGCLQVKTGKTCTGHEGDPSPKGEVGETQVCRANVSNFFHLI